MENKFRTVRKREIYRLVRLAIVICFLPCVLLASVVAFPVYLCSRLFSNDKHCINLKKI